MLRITLLFLSFLVCAAAHAERIVYERIFSLGSPGDNTLTIAVEDSGEVLIHRPSIMTRSGSYVRYISPARFEQLWASVVSLDLDEEALESRWRQRQRDEMIAVTDAETTIIRLENDQREPITQIHATAVMPRVKLPGHSAELIRLSDMEDVFWALMTELMGEDES